MRTAWLPVTAAALTVGALACAEGPTAPVQITALPRALSAAEQALIAADNRFAFKLLRRAAAETGDTVENLFISPLSVAMALAMTYNGAAGTTEEAMRATLELEGMAVLDVNAAYRGLIDLLRRLDPQVRFRISNSIWYRQDVAVEQPFIAANRTFYDARVEALDFASPGAAQVINGWVSEQTEGLIREVVESPIPQNDLLYLINAIYFKGNWTRQFDKNLTAPRPFRLVDGTTTTVPTMTYGREVAVRVAGDQAVEVLDLPYGGRAFSMTIVMPREAGDIDALTAGLTTEQWDAWIAGLDSTGSDVSLPKFTLTNDLLLNSTLAALGMGIAFTEAADFGRMTPRGVFISRVKHKTYVDVNEEGTEAAAVTAVAMTDSEGPRVSVDRPFVFALRENLSGTILFLGVIRNPAAD